MPKKESEDSSVVIEHITSVLESTRKTAENIDIDIDSIKRFVKEVVGVFITDTRFIKDQLLILAQRLAELEELAYEFSEKRKKES
ncbi:MAG: hypothetical protein Q6363_002335 [Candidatus Njordarchaeota archaeon]